MEDIYTIVTIGKSEGPIVEHNVRSFSNEILAKKYYQNEVSRIKDTYDWIGFAEEEPGLYEGAQIEDHEDEGYFCASCTSDDGWDRYVEVCMHEEHTKSVLVLFEWETGDGSAPIYSVARIIQMNECGFCIDRITDVLTNHAEDFDADLSYEEMVDEVLDSLLLDYAAFDKSTEIDMVRSLRI